MDAAQLVEVARLLLDQAACEAVGPRRAALVRSAINRMYYACLWASSKALRDVGLSAAQLPSGPALHGLLVDCLKLCVHEELSAAGQRLELLKKLRTRADYKPDDTQIERLENALPQLENVVYLIDVLRDVRTDLDKFSALQPRALELSKIRQGK